MKKQRRKAKAAKSFSAPTLYEAALIPAKIIQIVAGSGELYALDEKGKVYVYVGGSSAGWYQLKNDGLKFLLCKQQVVEEKNGHGAKSDPIKEQTHADA